MGHISELKQSRDRKQADIRLNRVRVNHNVMCLKEKAKDNARQPLAPVMSFAAGWLYGGLRSSKDRKGYAGVKRDKSFILRLAAPLIVAEFNRLRQKPIKRAVL